MLVNERKDPYRVRIPVIWDEIKRRLEFQESLWKNIIKVLPTTVFICLKLYGRKYFDGCNYYYKPLKPYKAVQIIVLIVLFSSGYHSWRNYVST